MRRLDEDLLVVGEREPQRRGELVARRDPRDADARPERGRLHEHGPAERLADASRQRRVVRIVPPVAQRQRWGDGDPGPAQHVLAEVLVHRDRRPEDARADVRQPDRLEQALHRSVLAERPVQRGEHHVDPRERRRPTVDLRRERGRAGQERRRKRRRARVGSLERGDAAEQPPGAVLADGDRKHLVALGIERGRHRPGRRERDLALRRAPAREHDDAQPAAHGLDGGVAGGVVVVVVSVVVVSVVGAV